MSTTKPKLMQLFYSSHILKSALTVIFLLAFQYLCSQTVIIDSLKTELKSHQKQDTTRVNLLNLLAFQHYRNNPPKAIEYIDESLKLANELGVAKFLAHSYYIKAVIYTEQANFNEALKNYGKSKELYTTLNDLKGLEKCNNAMGVLYSYKGEFKNSLNAYKKAMRIAEKRNDSKMIHKYLYNIGIIYRHTGEYEKALENFDYALEINKKNKDSLGILNSLNSIASLYYEQGNYPVSLDYHNKSLQIAERINDSIGIFQSHINIGNLYRQQNDNEKALNFYNKALSINNAQFNVKNVTALKNNIAGVYFDNNEYDKAISNYNASVKLSREIEDDVNLVTALNGLGFIYLEIEKFPEALSYFEESKTINLANNYSYDLADSYQGLAETYFEMKNFNLALLNTKKLAEVSEEYKYLTHKKNAYSLFSRIYKNKGDFKKAFESHQQFKVLSDSILNEDNIKKITQLEYEYKYEKELDAAEKREVKLTKTVETTSKDLAKTQRNLLLGIISFLTVAILLGSIIFYLKLRNSKAKTQNIITEQKLLRTQMTPHFIFNSLSVLQGMILNKEASKSVSYLSKFSKLLRITLENSRDKTVLLSKELEAVDNYLSLQTIENENINFKLNVDSTIDTNTIKIPPMLIQPFVENAIEHAFKNHKENAVVEIHLKLEGAKLICCILDNGIGIDSSERNINQNKKSLATKITSERLKYLSKDFKMDASIAIEDRKKYDEKGTKITINIPYTKA